MKVFLCAFICIWFGSFLMAGNGKFHLRASGESSIGDATPTVQDVLRSGTPEEAGFDPELGARLKARIQKAIEERVFPAAAVAVGRDGILILSEGYGTLTYQSEIPVKPSTPFDLASLTKVVSTTAAIMFLVDRGQLNLQSRVTEFFPEFNCGGKENLTLEHLLTHTAGFRPFFSFRARGLQTRLEIQQALFREPIRTKPGNVCVYSDLSMIVLGWVVEKVSGMDQDSFMREHFWGPLGMDKTGYRPVGTFGNDPSIVPTEMDQTFRNRLLQGEVHDENAFLLGGVAGHAGVFSNVEDLSKFAFMLLNQGCYSGMSFFKPETVDFFTKRRSFEKGPDRGLGWDIKSAHGYSSSGPLAGPRTYGHLGFTGTSLWIDPDQKLFFILLTNRVYPSREEKRHNQVRSDVGEIIYQCMMGPPLQDQKPLVK